MIRQYPYYSGTSLFSYDNIVTDISVKQTKVDPIRDQRRAMKRVEKYMKRMERKNK